MNTPQPVQADDAWTARLASRLDLRRLLSRRRLAPRSFPKRSLLFCLYTCERDRPWQAQLERSALLRRVRADPRFRVLQVHADPALDKPRLHGETLTLPCPEDYGALSLKTWHLTAAAARIFPKYRVLLKLDVTVASNDQRPASQPGPLKYRVTSDAVLAALPEVLSADKHYNGLLSQRVFREGFEAWSATKGLNCDFARVFSEDRSTPEYFLGKFYALGRPFGDYIASEGKAMALEHLEYLGGSEDMLVGRLYARWCGNAGTV